MRIIWAICVLFFSITAHADKLLHVSFDITRELFKETNKEFIKEYNPETSINQSHGGSGKQTMSVIHGLPADIVSLALPYHMDLLAEKGKVAKNWRELFPNNSSPLTTSIVFLVRKGNPKNIKDWNDLIRPDIKIITGNPKTSGGALWNYVAAWIYASKIFKDDDVLVHDYLSKLYKNVPILDSTARTAAVTFMKRKLGDVLITWANEANYVVNNLDSNYEVIYPSLTVKIDIPIATIITSEKKYQDLANQYINFLFSPKGQAIITKYYYQAYNAKTPLNQNVVNADDYIDWKKFKDKHFAINGVFDFIYK